MSNPSGIPINKIIQGDCLEVMKTLPDKFAKILSDFSEPHQTILDPFLGSGTTALACIKTNRNFIGIEKEPKYVEIAQKRIDNELSQMRLF